MEQSWWNSHGGTVTEKSHAVTLMVERLWWNNYDEMVIVEQSW